MNSNYNIKEEGDGKKKKGYLQPVSHLLLSAHI